MNPFTSPFRIFTNQRRDNLRKRPYYFGLKVLRYRVASPQSHFQRNLSKWLKKLRVVCLKLSLTSECQQESNDLAADLTDENLILLDSG